MAKQATRKNRKMPVRVYEVGLPVRYLAEVTVKATSRVEAEAKALQRVAGRRDYEAKPYIRRVK